MNKNLKEIIEYEVNFLKNTDDSVGIKINDTKGLFIQIIDYGEGKEYLLELNDINSDGCYEPCASYNASSKYGNINNLIKKERTSCPLDTRAPSPRRDCFPTHLSYSKVRAKIF